MKMKIIAVALLSGFAGFSYAAGTPVSFQPEAHSEMTGHPHDKMAHMTSSNADAVSYQSMADMHIKMMGHKDKTDNTTASNNFADYSEHEKAAVAHENMSNGSAWAHQSQAEKHRAMMSDIPMNGHAG
ncbi:hypothetical protein ABMA09_26195 (plasmid) [Erwinia rhapontici]|uniref:hypothetical protein n=1 Tax=Erwinia rhapontici TaxID=55212 RepID=UPI003D3648C8